MKIGDIVQFSLKNYIDKKSYDPIITAKIIDEMKEGYICIYISKIIKTSDGYTYGYLGYEGPYKYHLPEDTNWYFGIQSDLSNVDDFKIVNSSLMITE